MKHYYDDFDGYRHGSIPIRISDDIPENQNEIKDKNSFYLIILFTMLYLFVVGLVIFISPQ